MKYLIKIAFAHSDNGHNDKGISAGITQFIRNKGLLQLIPWPDNSFESLSFLRKQGCQGAIVNVATYASAKRILDIPMPVIAYSSLQDMRQIPYISTDSKQLAKMAFDYLSQKQFKHLGFFGLSEVRWADERLKYFSEFVSGSGKTLHVFKGKPTHVADNLPSYAKLWTSTTMKRGQQELVSWLRDLPKPIGILVSCDVLGCHLTHLAKESGLSIPEDIAILGIDNNEAICNISIPRLSSIALNLNKAGYDAAELLYNIITEKERLNGQRINIQPLQVKERSSTDVFAIDDPDVVKALRYIRQNSHRLMQVDDIAQHVCSSKRSLQIKFHNLLNTSIHDEIIYAHFLVARSLLIETDVSIDQIAIRSGFRTSSNMRRAFTDIAGMLPHKYRQTHSPKYYKT